MRRNLIFLSLITASFIPVSGLPREQSRELPEVVVESRQNKFLHMLAYVREYSTLSTYSDTVILFREKMVDYMLPSQRKNRFRGWTYPRILTAKSYYRFVNTHGLDSVSDRCNHHFSWADWVGVAPASLIPQTLAGASVGVDTVRGKYRPTEIWRRDEDRMTLDVDVLADTDSRKWVPNLSLFFRDDIDFEDFRIRFDFENVAGKRVEPIDLAGYSFNIESKGRGHPMFMFNRISEPYYVSTRAEVYLIDKEYVTVKEAKKWEERGMLPADFVMFEPSDAPELTEDIRRLIDRVNSVDHDKTRLAFTPDQRLVGRRVEKVNIGREILKRLKQMFGLDYLNGNRKREKQWRQFRRDQIRRNTTSED